MPSPIRDGEMTDLAHVAIVDDDDALRSATALLLRESGMQTSVYRDGDIFLASAPFDQLRCILLDMRMPRMDGLTVLQALRQRRVTTPVVLLTGYVDVPLAVRAMREGAFNLLQKPYGPAALLDAVREAIACSDLADSELIERNEAQQMIAGLAPRQRQIMAGLIKGHQNKIIAAKLGLSVRTVEAHRRVVMRKLRARSLSDVLRRAVTAGLPIVEIDYDGRWETAVEERLAASH